MPAALSRTSSSRPEVRTGVGTSWSRNTSAAPGAGITMAFIGLPPFRLAARRGSPYLESSVAGCVFIRLADEPARIQARMPNLSRHRGRLGVYAGKRAGILSSFVLFGRDELWIRGRRNRQSSLRMGSFSGCPLGASLCVRNHSYRRLLLEILSGTAAAM